MFIYDPQEEPGSYPWKRPGYRSKRNDTFVFLRTKTALKYATKPIDSFRRNCPAWINILGIYHSANEYIRWENGIVLHCELYETAEIWPEAMEAALSKFESWGALDDSGHFSESISNGPFSRFFHPDGKAAHTEKFAQIYLHFRGNREDPDQLVDKLRSCFWGKRVVPVFHFNNGRVLLVETDEPCTILRRRIESELRNFQKVTIFDSELEDWSTQGAVEFYNVDDLDLTRPEEGESFHLRPKNPLDKIGADDS